MTDDTYNGYANRETWAFNLHWQNDQGLYNETLEVAGQHVALMREEGHELSDSTLGEHVVNYWHDATDYDNSDCPLTETLRRFRDEVGSWWRIDYAEVGSAVRESLDAEA